MSSEDSDDYIDNILKDAEKREWLKSVAGTEAHWSDWCQFCGKKVDKDNPDNWHALYGWVHGTKKDGLTLRNYTGALAHDECIQKANKGQAPDQPELF
jgi:hypothetical protein